MMQPISRLLSASSDWTVKLWDVLSGKAKVGDRVNVGPDGRHPLHWFEADTGRRVQGL